MTKDAAASWPLFGDFSRIIIAHRVGETIKGTIPSLEPGPYPEGESGLFEWWRKQGRTDDA